MKRTMSVNEEIFYEFQAVCEEQRHPWSWVVEDFMRGYVDEYKKQHRIDNEGILRGDVQIKS